MSKRPIGFRFGNGGGPFRYCPPIRKYRFGVGNLEPMDLVRLLSPCRVTLGVYRGESANAVMSGCNGLLCRGRTAVPEGEVNIRSDRSGVCGFCSRMERAGVLPKRFSGRIVTTLKPGTSRMPRMVSVSVVRSTVACGGLTQLVGRSTVRAINIAERELNRRGTSRATAKIRTKIGFSRDRARVCFGRRDGRLVPEMCREVLRTTRCCRCMGNGSRVSCEGSESRGILLSVRGLSGLLESFGVGTVSGPGVGRVGRGLRRLFLASGALRTATLSETGIVCTSSTVRVVRGLHGTRVRGRRLSRHECRRRRTTRRRTRGTTERLGRLRLRRGSSRGRLSERSGRSVTRVETLNNVRASDGAGTMPSTRRGLGCLLGGGRVRATGALGGSELSFSGGGRRSTASLGRRRLLSGRVVRRGGLTVTLIGRGSGRSGGLGGSVTGSRKMAGG